MIKIRPGNARGHFDHGWLNTYHTFSFSNYYDPDHMGFRSLRVINEDWVAPGSGFGMHPHRDMEIVTYVLSGSLEHKDSLGTHGVIKAGEVQRITAGTGILHSEFNPSSDEPVHLYQIWLLPDQRGHVPSYEQKSIAQGDKTEGATIRLIASPDGANGSLTIHQDARIFAASLAPEARLVHDLEVGRRAWIQVVKGEARIGDGVLRAGDGASVEAEPRIAVESHSGGEVLIFDLN
jgi:quercetin 2,3-dioxygenase